MRFAILGFVVASTFATAAVAAPVLDGTVSAVATFNPTITLGATQSTYSAVPSGGTFEISGTGGFSGIAGTMGTLSGNLNFSNTVGTVIAQAVPNFFVFSDGKGGTYNYSIESVQTNAFVNMLNAKSGTLLALGTIVNASMNMLTATPASLSIQFNNTGASAFSSALTLSVPPVGMTAVPEPATWAMMISGLGLIGYAMRRRPKVTTRVSFN
jgi:hypothetical protein